jgi:RHS repeat-associated protein
MPCCLGGPPFWPDELATADVNRDGIPDLLVGNANNGSLMVFLGHGDGTFAGAATYAGYGEANSIAVGDLNGDGIPDAVLGDGGSDGLPDYTVFLGKGDGTFTPGTTHALTVSGEDVQLGDLNGDGKLDMVLSTLQNEIGVLLGNGDGTFGAPTFYAIHGRGRTATVADVNGDGHPDVVVAEGDPPGADPGTIAVFLDNANGTLQPRAGYIIGNTYTSALNIAVGDFNRDGAPDLAVELGGSTEIFMGTGGGSFTSSPSVNLAEDASTGVRVADVTGDGNLDVISSNFGSTGDEVSVYPGNGDGTFATRADYQPPDTNTQFRAITVGDVNRDGKPDVITASGGNPNTGVSPEAAVYLNVTTGPFAPIGGPVTTKEARNPNESCPCLLYTRPARAEPVDTVDGDFTEQYTDMAIPGRGFPLAFVRTYNSLAAGTNGRLGYGWTDSYNAQLTQDPTTGMVTVTQENGSQSTFAKVGTATPATYAPTAPRTIATLTQNSDGSWVFTRKAEETLRFSAARLLTSEADRNGYTTTLTYNGSNQLTTVTDPASRSLTLGYTGNLLTSVTDPTGRVVQYGYNDGLGNLTDVTDVNGGNTHFTYDTGHHVLTIRDPRGNTVTTNHYDTSNRVDYQLDALNRQTTFTYAADGSYTITTDPMGNQIKDTFSSGVRLSTTKGYGTSAAATWTYTYDPYTLGVIGITDPNGHTTYRTYDGSGNTLTSSDGLGRTTTYEYNSFNEPIAMTDPKGVTTTMTYDANGNLLTTSTPLVGSSPLQHAVTTNTYGDSTHPGDVTAVTDPDNKQWLRSYDTDGDLASTTDPLGDKATYTYNSIGWLQSAVSPRGNVTGANPAQFTTSYSYADPSTGAVDEFGDVRVVTDPLGHKTTTSYDADRNVSSVKDGDSNTTSYVYDAANERTDVQRADGTTLHTDFNLDGTVKDQLDGAGNKTAYGYDALARVTSVTDPLSRVTSYAYDGAGNLLTKLDPVTGATCTATPKVGCTTKGYDAADELTSITYSDGTTPNVTMGYDADGQRTSMRDGTGSSAWVWDSLHRMTSSTDGAGKTVQYGYDLKGNLTSMTYPDGHNVTKAYDAAGRLTGVTDWLGHTTTFTPDPDANITAQAYANGTTATSQYNNADQLTSISDAPTSSPNSPFASFGYGRDGNGQVSSGTSSGAISESNSYTYTHLNQLSSTSAGGYTIDKADNILTTPDQTSQSYDAADEITTRGDLNAISLVTSGQASDQLGTSTTLTVNLPVAAQANDEIVVVSAENNGPTFTLPSGYQVVRTAVTSGQPPTVSDTAMYHKAAGGENQVQIGYTAQNPKSLFVAVYRGVDPSTPVDGSVSSWWGNFASSVTVPQITTSVAGERLLLAEAEAGSPSAESWSVPGMTQVQQNTGTPLTSGGIAEQFDPTAGPTGSRTATISPAPTSTTPTQMALVFFALRPARITFTYDTRGNRTAPANSSAGSGTLGYDQANRLVSFGSTATYKYNGDGLRMSKTVAGATSTFVYDQAEGLALPIVDGTTEYVYGPGGTPLEQVTPTPAAISLVGTGSGGNPATTTSTSATVTLPTGIQAHDQILVGVTFPAGTGNTVSTPSGYAAVGSPVQAGTGPTADILAVFRKTAAGTEGGTTLTVSFSGAFASALEVAVYRGVDPSTPVDVVQPATAASASSIPTGTATTRYANEQLVVLQGATYVGAAPQGWAVSTGLTERNTAPNNATISAGVADGTSSSPGTVGPYTSTFGTPAGSTTGQLTSMLVGLHQPPSVVFFHHDQLGSTRILTDTAGQVISTFTYDPYGRLSSSTGATTTPLLYAGQYRDTESGFFYLRARYYDPSTAQFVSRDPLASITGQPYGYASDDPLDAVDPGGTYDYTYSWRLGSVSELGSAQHAMAYFQAHPGAIFPFPIGGCSTIVLDAECHLQATAIPTFRWGIFAGQGFAASGSYVGDDPVRVTSVTSTSFTFTSLPGHFDGPNGTITFRTYEENGDLYLCQVAHAPNASWVVNIFGPEIAKTVWAQQAANLSQALTPNSARPPWPGPPVV